MAVTNETGDDIDAVETSEWLEALDAVVAHDGPDRARELLPASSSAPSTPGRADRKPQHAVCQHDPARAGGAAPRRSGGRAPAALDRALERDRDGRARQQGVLGARRPHRQLPVAGDAVRGRLQPLLARAERGARRRPRLLPGPLVAGQLRARVPGGPADARSSSTAFARRSAATGCRSYPHPWLMPDFWQFPTVSLGIGPITSIYQARFMKYLQARGMATPTDARCGRSSATARWTSPSRWARSGSPAASSSTT